MQVMIMLKGHPGSGKSSLSRYLARRLKWPIVDKDDSKDILMTQPGCPEEGQANALSYNIMLRTAQTQLQCGLSVVVDCPLARIELYQQAAEIASKNGARVLVVECHCQDQKVWQQRLESRAKAETGTAAAHKPQNWAELEALLERYNGSDQWLQSAGPDSYSVVVDTSSQTTEQGGDQVLSYMRKAGLIEQPSLSADDPVFLSSG